MQQEQLHVEDVFDERRRGLISILAWSTLGLLATGLLFTVGPTLVGGPPPRNPLAPLLFAIGIAYSGVALLLLRRKKTLAAALLIVYGFALIVTISVLSLAAILPTVGLGRPDPRLQFFFFLNVLWAGLLIGGRAAFLIATLASSVISISAAMTYPFSAAADVSGYIGVLLQFHILTFACLYGIAFGSWFFNRTVVRIGVQLGSRAVVLAASNELIRREVTQREETSKTMLALAEQVAGASQQQLGVVSRQNDAVRSVSTTLEELDRASAQIAGMAGQAGEFAANAQRETGRGQEVIGAALNALQQVDGSVEEISGRMAVLQERLQLTENVAQQISTIADELQVLALNARIEAAGAAGAGLRFAVVAAEVARLAAEARQGAEQTRELLAEVRDASQATVRATEEGQLVARSGALLAQDAANANTYIGRMVQQASEQVLAIGQSSDQQRLASQQVINIMHDLTDASQATERASEETATIAGKLRSLAHGLGESRS